MRSCRLFVSQSGRCLREATLPASSVACRTCLEQRKLQGGKGGRSPLGATESSATGALTEGDGDGDFYSLETGVRIIQELSKQQGRDGRGRRQLELEPPASAVFTHQVLLINCGTIITKKKGPFSVLTVPTFSLSQPLSQPESRTQLATGLCPLVIASRDLGRAISLPGDRA